MAPKLSIFQVLRSNYNTGKLPVVCTRFQPTAVLRPGSASDCNWPAADIASLNQHPAKPTLNSLSSNAALLGGQLRDTAWHKLHLTCDETGK